MKVLQRVTERQQAIILLAGLSFLVTACADEGSSSKGELSKEESQRAEELSTSTTYANSLEIIEVLASDAMQGRQTGTDGGALARTWLTGQLSVRALQPFSDSGFEYAFEFTRRNGKKVSAINLIAKIPGVLRENKKAIIVSAHYDHVGVRKGSIYNGADDNASGVAGALAIAEAFLTEPPQNDIIIALLDAEEMGLEGAKAILRDELIPLSEIGLNVNLDMISRSDKNELYLAGAWHTPSIKQVLADVVATAPVNLLYGHDDPALGSDDWTLQSDHGPFHQAGIPFVYFGVEDHPHYHQPSDDFETIPQEFFARSLETIIMATRQLDRDLANIK